MMEKRSPQELLAAALEYHAVGWPVIPVDTKKRPACREWGHWRFQAQTEDEVQNLFSRPAHGIAILTWPASDLMTLDFDGPHAEELWNTTRIVLPVTSQNRTRSGGRHCILKAPPDTPRPEQQTIQGSVKRSIRLVSEQKPCGANGTKTCGVDLLLNGYFIVPPTPGYHEDPDHPFEPGQLSVIPPDVIRLAQQRDKRSPVPVQGDTNWVAQALRGPVPEGQRNETAAKLAGFLLLKGHSPDHTFALLKPWAQTVCVPPMDPRELQTTVQSIARLEATRRHKEDSRAEIETEAASIAWEVFDAADYKTWKVDPLQWPLEPIMTKDSIGYVGGLPKIGKSLLMFDLLLHIIHQRPWLGRYSGDWIPRIMYLAREDPKGRLQARIDEMQEGYGFPSIPRSLFRLLVRERFQLTDPSHKAWLVSFCKDQGIDFVVLDVLGRMIRGKDQMDPADWGEIQDILEELNRNHGLTVVILDHARKPAVGAGKTVQLSPVEIKGPIEKYGGADWSLVIGRTKEPGRLEIVTEGKDTDERLHFLVDVAPKARRKDERWEVRQADGTWQPGLPGPKLTYAGDVVELAEGRREVGRKNREAVYATIPTGERLQIGTVLERLEQAGHKLSRSTVGTHLKALVEEEKKLDSTGDGRNAWYWRREEGFD